MTSVKITEDGKGGASIVFSTVTFDDLEVVSHAVVSDWKRVRENPDILNLYLTELLSSLLKQMAAPNT